LHGVAKTLSKVEGTFSCSKTFRVVKHARGHTLLEIIDAPR